MKKLFFTLLIFSCFVIFTSCGNSNSDETKNEKTTTQEKDNSNTTSNKKESCGFPIETEKDFLNYVIIDGSPKTFESAEGEYIFFTADGTMGGGGASGEGSMWEADWKFKSGSPTGQIIFTVTMEGNSEAKELKGAYNVEIFPDDGALILNCVDYYEVRY